MHTLSNEDREDLEVMQFVEDDGQVIPFLEGLLHKYESAQIRFAC
ncbi:hypothetical protein [Trinickia dinghuensis]|nr:hypothetical protein [Trinickia dinghuensis]